MYEWLGRLFRWWEFWRDEKISLRAGFVYGALIAVISFLLGGYHPEADYRRIKNKLEAQEADLRLFANEISRRNGLQNTLQARESLHKKTIELLSKRIESLLEKNIQTEEQSALYRQIFGKSTGKDNDIAVYVLEANPDFDPNFSAAQRDRRPRPAENNFNGGYFFEIAKTNGNGEHIVQRHPESGFIDFQMKVYHDINERVQLPTADNIENLRFVIVDKKENVVATAQLADYADEADDGGIPLY